MKKEAFEIVALATKQYVLDSGMKNTSENKFVKRLCKIILDERDVYYKYKYNEKIEFKKIDQIVTDYLEFLNPYYVDYYNMRKNDGSFIFTYSNQESAWSAYDLETKDRIIYIPLTNTIVDCYSIVHELMHDLNLDVNIDSSTRFLYTEGLSLLGEFLLEFYLKNKHIKQFNNPNSNGLYCLKSKAIETDLNLKLIETYINDGYVDEGSIYKILDEYDIDYRYDLIETIRKINYSGELTLDFEQPYIIGGIMATYMYDRIMNNKNNILELFELNKMLNIYSFDQVLDYLELDYDEQGLTEESYKILEEKYKKYLKSR